VRGCREAGASVVIELDPGPSFVVSSEELARLYDRSDTWARRLLREWWDEQQAGGELRVFRRPWKPKGFAYFTTRAVLQRTMPSARDMLLVRKVEALEKDLTFMARKVDALMDRVRALEGRKGR
jgi:hypothetical protein